ncbi:MAG: RNA polymerase sigma factor [Planctomycetota bacterium]|jgi:RNA polymerase sigma-70 factor (ECF subfamily)
MATRENQNEAALVCAARRGDKESLRLLLTRNWAWLKGLVYSILGDADEVDDVLQDICVRVITNIESLHQPERFRPWLAVLARRQALRRRQQRARKMGFSPPIKDGGASPTLLSDERSSRFPEDMERAEQCERILEAAGSLPEKYREAFMMAYAGDLTYRQIGEILDIPVTTVQIRLVRARRMIHDQVADRDASTL